MCVQSIQAETNIQLIPVCLFSIVCRFAKLQLLGRSFVSWVLLQADFLFFKPPLSFFFFFFPSSSVLSRRNKENLGFFFRRIIFWSGKFISDVKFQRLKTAAKKNISCSDCHKKELFVVFFMLLFKAAKLICNKL